MEVTTRLARKDFFLMYLYLFPRMKGNWIFFLLLWIGLGFFRLTALAEPESVLPTVALILACGAASLATTTAIFLWGVIWMTAMADTTGAALRNHHFTVTEDGLGDKTSAGETLTRWSDIALIRRVGPYLHIRINGRLFHVIPKKSFPSTEAFRGFGNALIAKWKAQTQGAHAHRV